MNVGDLCICERRSCTGGLDHRWEKPITKLTPKRVYMGPRDWFALDDPQREVKPKYLDYTTRVVRVESQPSSDTKKGGV